MRRSALSALLFLAACGGRSDRPPEPKAAPRPLAPRPAARAPAPPVAAPPLAPAAGAPLAPAELRAFAGTLDALTLQIFRRLPDGENVAIAGPVVASALGLAAPGAREATRREFERVLPLAQGDARFHEVLGGLLAARTDRCLLSAANAAFVEETLQLEPAWVDAMAGARAQLVPVAFSRDPEKARGRINGWAREATRGAIDELVPRGVIDPLTRLALVSAASFTADWAQPFSRSATVRGAFHLASGETIEVPKLAATERLRFARTEGVRLVELPYACAGFSMVLLASDTGDDHERGSGPGGRGRRGEPAAQRMPLDAIEEALTPERLAGWIGAAREGIVSLRLPRFRVESAVELKPVLARAGLRRAMSPTADYGRIANVPLQVQAVPHRTFVEVNEQGTRAGAAAAVILGSRGAPPIAASFDFDRPFLFLIREKASGLLLFVGRVAQPHDPGDPEPIEAPAEPVRRQGFSRQAVDLYREMHLPPE